MRVGAVVLLTLALFTGSAAASPQERPRAVPLLPVEVQWLRLPPEARRRLAEAVLTHPEAPPRGPLARFVKGVWARLRHRGPTHPLPPRLQARIRLLVQAADVEARKRRVLRELPRRLHRMARAGLVREEEVHSVLELRDPERRLAAYQAVRDLAFLRQMHRAGRVDQETFHRIQTLSGAARRRAINRLRWEAFLRVNAHLLVWLVPPAEAARLRRSRFGFEARLRRLENRLRVRFLPIFPSRDPRRLSHLLRLTPAEEERLARRDLRPLQRRRLALAVYRRQREALLRALARGGVARRLRRYALVLRSARTPEEFYRRALRLVARQRPRGGRGH